MLSAAKRTLFVTLSIVFSVSSAHAQSYEARVKEAQAIKEKLNVKDGAVAGRIGSVEEDLHGRFKGALDFIFAVAKDGSLTKEEKVNLIVDVSEETGEFFTQLTAPYDDMNRFEYKWNPNWSRAKNVLNAIVPSTKFFVQGVWRDISSQFRGKTLPFVGADSQRSALINKMGKDIEKCFEEAAAMEKTPDGQMSLGAVLKLIEEVKPSEAVMNGGFHRLVRHAYLGLGILFFLHPPVEMFFGLSIERTTFSPLVAGADWFAIMMSLRYSRGVNSGVAFYNRLNSITKKIQKLNVDETFAACNKNMQVRQ